MSRISTWCLLGAAACLTLLSVSCDSADRSASALGGKSTPLATAESFVEALNAADPGELEKVLTLKAREGMKAGSGFSLNGGQLERVVYGTATEDATSARLTITATREGKIEDVTLHMRPEEGEWRIHAFEVGLPGKGAMLLDLEMMGQITEQIATSMAEGLQQAFEDGMREQEERDRLERRRTFEQLRPLSVEAVESSFIVTEDDRGRPVRDVVERIAREIGLPVRFDAALTDARVAAQLSDPVAADLVGLSHLAAIDRVLRDIGSHATYPDPQELSANPLELPPVTTVSSIEPQPRGDGFETGSSSTLTTPDFADLAAIEVKPGPAPEPVVYAGPFRVTVAEVEQYSQYGTGEVTVETRAYGLDPAIGGASASLSETVRFDQVADARGRELRENPDVHFLGGNAMVRGATGSRTSLDLRGLLADVPEIATVRGSQTLAVPTAVESLTIDPLAVGMRGELGGLTYEVKSVGRSFSIAFRGVEGALENLHCVGVPIDAEGSDISVEYDSTMEWGNDEVQYQLQSKEVPVRVELRCVLAAVELSFPFELEGIALPDHAKAPRSLPELEFTGASVPVAVEYLKITGDLDDFPKVSLTVRNHSNKDVASISCAFEYVDRAGKKLDEFPHSLNGPGSFDGPAPLVAAGKTTPHEATAFFVPEGTTRVGIRVTEIEFMDGTTWAGE